MRNAPRLKLGLLAVAIGVGCGMALAAHGAEDAGMPYIKSEGEATVDAAPEYAEFWIHKEVAGDTLAAAVDLLADFEQTVRTGMDALQLATADVEFTAVAVPKADAKTASRSVKLRYSMAPFSAPDKGAAQFATLCDGLTTLAAKLGGIIEGPTFTLADPPALVQTAVQRAVENAYPSAEAAAAALNTQLTTVQSISVWTVEWNKTPHHNGPEPSLRRVSCTVRVEVTYLFSLAPR